MVLVLALSLMQSFAWSLDLEFNVVEQLKPLTTLEKFSTNSDKERLIYFWATWCPVCKDKLNTVFKKDEIYQKFDVQLVATDTDKEKIEHFINKMGLKRNVYTDENKFLQKALNVHTMPTVARLKRSNSKWELVKIQVGGSLDEFLQ